MKFSAAFGVMGKPYPKGSMKALTSKSTGKIILIHQNNKELKEWMNKIKKSAKRVAPDAPIKAPWVLRVLFAFERPPSVKRVQMSVKPDLDKLLRSILDALTGVFWDDDSQVVHIEATKMYSLMANTIIEADVIESLDEVKAFQLATAEVRA